MIEAQIAAIKAAKARRDELYAVEHPSSWAWSELELRWIPPINPPDNLQPYEWDETTLSWVLGKEPI